MNVEVVFGTKQVWTESDGGRGTVGGIDGSKTIEKGQVLTGKGTT